jgi:RNA recognition motif-containing protein
MSKRHFKNQGDDQADDPPLSRLFIVCSKSTTEDDFQDAFEKFGQIEDIRILKDRDGISKGVAYIKFSKTSEAALACEAMNGQSIGRDTQTRPIKVIVAAR